ncbi:hypothetical protein P43SY_002320 [Pythium insidiosum]|uniref:Nascent polypeptide-associated complex subunit alpha-like UBA domain-containing protein n=1 Tax=Pythium insidiosum TaxID=114742 RepID=A0AAD5QES5_PYTIN|nr:hypothetical protein P43SY_002320 [Pythium insidiosum]
MSPSKVTSPSKKKSDNAAAEPAPPATATADNESGEAVVSDDEDDGEKKDEVTTKSKAEQSSALDKLTDHVEEKQMDENKMKEAFLALRKQEEADKEAERKREKQLAAVKVKKEDVELIARELEMTTQQADRKLREHNGDVLGCLKALVA